MKIKGVRLFLLRFQGNRALIYVYREKQLASRLNSPEADVLTPSDFDSSKISAYDAIAFGCPAMGAEVQEEAEFEPMWNECEGRLSGVKIALFVPMDGATANGCAPGKRALGMPVRFWPATA